MLEIIFLLLPGAISYMVMEKCSGEKNERTHVGLMQWMVFAGVDFGVFWLIRRAQGMSEIIVTEYGMPHVLFGGLDYITSIAIAIIVGILAAFGKELGFRVIVDKEGEGIFSHLNEKVKTLLRRVVVVLAFVGMLAIILKPSIDSAMVQRQKTSFMKKRETLLVKLQNEAADILESGTDVSEFENIELNSLTVKRVSTDQSWRSPSSSGKEEAVYMIDGDGTITYFSYRDAKYVSTWSGPSKDKEFTSSHGGWNGGRGYGWTGMDK